MDWRRFKTIIIIVLITINIFFGGYLIRMKWMDSRVSSETRDNVIAILGNNNITLSEDNFPENRESYSACYVSRVLASDKDFINGIIGKDGSFSAENEVFTFEFAPEGSVGTDEDEIIESCKSFMEEHGILADLYLPEGIKTSGNSTAVRFYLEYDDCRFFDSYIDFTLSEKGICKISGKNIIKAEENISSYEDELLPVESIVVTVVKDKKTEDKVSIKNMTFGYYLGDSADVYVSVLAIPVWKIDFSDGDSLSYDARNGNLINM